MLVVRGRYHGFYQSDAMIREREEGGRGRREPAAAGVWAGLEAPSGYGRSRSLWDAIPAGADGRHSPPELPVGVGIMDHLIFFLDNGTPC